MSAAARVVIADDDADLRRLLTLMLHRDGRFTVVAEAGDGAQALALVRDHDPDLLLLDLSMPVMDGLQVLEELRRPARPRIAVLTGFAQPELHAEVVAAGAAACFEKGQSFRLLCDGLAGLMSGN